MSGATSMQALENWAGALLQRLSPVEQQRLALNVARQLRRSQQKNMRAQQGPDGTAWELRKTPAKTLRDAKTGPMMRGLAAAKYLRARPVVAEPEAHRIEHVAEHAREGLQDDLAVVWQAAFAQLRFDPGHQWRPVAQAKSGSIRF